MDISIIIVTYKDKGFIRECVESYKRRIPKRLLVEIIVVDNNSGDGTREIAENLEGIKLIKNDRNIGFGKANNIGIQLAKGKYIFISNPDIFVYDNVLETLYDFMEENHKAGICAPKLLYPDDSDMHGARMWPKHFATPLAQRSFFGQTAWGRKVSSEYVLEADTQNLAHPVPWIVGAAMFIRKTALEKVGKCFDERYFIYCEDTDLCREFWQKGHEVWYVPYVQMTHFHKRDSARGGVFAFLKNRMHRIHVASYLKYLRKWRGIPNPHV